MSSGEEEQRKRQRRDQAISACCLAAAAVADPALPPIKQGKALMAALGVLLATYRERPSLSMAEFRRGLRGPLRGLLPRDIRAGALADVTLLTDDGLQADVMDVGLEHLVPQQALAEHWPWARVQSEQQERRAFEALRRLSAEDYVRARRLLVEAVSGEIGALRRSWERPAELELYEPIEGQSWRLIRGHWFPCPRCRWPMRVSLKRNLCDVRCEAHARDGYVYTSSGELDGRGAPQLEAAGPRDAPAAIPATDDYLALKRDVWRYMTLPGLLELELEAEALALGATVEMWPHKDRYDLRISLRKNEWKIDAKAWASVMKLSEVLSERSPAEPGLLIVIPNHQHAEREFLNTRIRKHGYRALTQSGLIKELRRAKRGAL